MDRSNKAGYRGPECIERVKQHSPMPKGQPGKMSMRPDKEAQWSRSGSVLTPRKA